MNKPANCPHPFQPADVWWADLALRLEKAVYVMSDSPDVVKVFQAAGDDAKNIAELMAGVAKKRAEKHVEHS